MRSQGNLRPYHGSFELRSSPSLRIHDRTLRLLDVDMGKRIQEQEMVMSAPSPLALTEMQRLRVGADALRKADQVLKLVREGTPLDLAVKSAGILPKTFVNALVILKTFRGVIEI